MLTRGIMVDPRSPANALDKDAGNSRGFRPPIYRVDKGENTEDPTSPGRICL